MTSEQFDALVRRVEQRFEYRPFALKLQIAAFVVVGYCVFLSWLLGIAVVGALLWQGALALDASIGLMLLIVGGFVLVFGGIEACLLMWLPVEAPKGRVLKPSEFPELHELLSQIRRELHCGRVSRVLLTTDFNAAVVEQPRLGLLGWSRTYLLLGLPLLNTLSMDELRAVLGHEFAHLSAHHGRFSGWIYRLRSSWELVFNRLQTIPVKNSFDRTLRRLLGAWIDWYWPSFNAHAFVLSRENEYEADRAAARVGGARHLASALWRMDCSTLRLAEKFWNDLWQLANTQTEPPEDVFDRMHGMLRQAPEEADAQRWMEQASQVLTDNADTHPALSDRLRALELRLSDVAENRFPMPAQRSSISELFGIYSDSLQREMNQQWQQDVLKVWRERQARAVSLQHRLGSLTRAIPDVERNATELWERARAVWELEGPEPALPLLRQVLELRPTHSAASLALGQHLLSQGHSEGEVVLRRVLDRGDDELTTHICEALLRHFRTTGDSQAMKEIRDRLSRYEIAVEGSQRERSAVSASDRFIEHGLTDDELGRLQETLQQDSGLERAWLVRKDLQHFPQQRLFVLCVQTPKNWLGRSNAERDFALVLRLQPQLKLPGRVFVLAAQGGFRALGRRVMSIPNAGVLDRQDEPIH